MIVPKSATDRGRHITAKWKIRKSRHEARAGNKAIHAGVARATACRAYDTRHFRMGLWGKRY
jgi:hypothetical protein